MSERLTREQQIAATAECLRTFAAGKPGRSLVEVMEMWNERAAIREYLGGLRHRRNAELHAVGDTFEYLTARERNQR